MGMSAGYESRFGKELPASGLLRVLVILAEIDYQAPAIDPCAGAGYPGWPSHQLPVWVDNPDPTQNLFEWQEPVGVADALFTRYYQQASSGNLIVIADRLVAPDNNGIFHVSSNTGLVGYSHAINAVNAAMSTLVTAHGLSVVDFDLWTTNGPGTDDGEEKISGPESPFKYDHVAVIWRNACGGPPNYSSIDNQGGANGGSPAPLLGYETNSWSNFNAYNNAPVNIMRHEFAHLIYGGNNFHTGGGGWNGNSGNHHFIQLSSGWSNLGLWNASLLSWNAWDRQRLAWKLPNQAYEIPAHDVTNTMEVDGDLDASVPGDAGIYVLRDFALHGDALRIKLPFTDPVIEYPEYIWVENHQGRNANGIAFDQWLYDDAACVEDLAPGLYMYMQIDKDVRQATSSAPIYAGYADYLRPLNASGSYDESFVPVIDPNDCVGYSLAPAFVRGLSNPLSGLADTYFVPVDKDVDDVLERFDFNQNGTEYVGGIYYDQLYCLGNTRHGFNLSGNYELGVGTNPSSASMMSCTGNSGLFNDPKNLRRIYLNGLSIEMLEQLPDGSIKVQVRFDDVDVTNDARWCADEIQLNPVVTGTGHSLNLTSGNTLTLDQGTTATRRTNPVVINGEKVFAPPTLMRCPDATWLNLEPNSEFVVDNNSTLRLEAGSRLDVGDGAVLRVKRGGKLELMGGCALNVYSGGKVIIEEDVIDGIDGQLLFHPNARINLEATTAELEIAGTLVIKENATFTTSRMADANAAYGRVRFSNTDVPSMNVVAEANTRFVLRSDNLARRILFVDQESLYGPNELAEFTLRLGTATLHEGARIVPPVTSTCAINFINARVTSPFSARNTHRGVRLNGQPFVILKESTFSNGENGLYCYNTVLGSRPFVQGCSFLNCGTGMYNYDRGIIATDSRFNQCDRGLICEQMFESSSLTHCEAIGNVNTGVHFQGAAKLRVLDPEFDGNDIGLALHQVRASVECGSISENITYGILVQDGATLFMNGTTGDPHDPVTAIDNEVTIQCAKANNCYLHLGYNSLRPTTPGIQQTLNGSFLCQPYSAYQDAYYNNWNGTAGVPLTTADYDITACGGPIYFVDPSSSDEVMCGQAVPPCHDPPCEQGPDALADCPTCSDVETDQYGVVKLNVASSAAKAMGDDDGTTNNERMALSGLNEILMNDVPAPTPDELFLLNYDYEGMMGSFSDALMKGQLVPDDGTSAMDDHLALVDEVQQKRIAEATHPDHSDFRFFQALERAQTYRASGELEEALVQLDALLTQTPIEHEDLVTRIRCLTQIELDVRDGILQWYDVDLAMGSCAAGMFKSFNGTDPGSAIAGAGALIQPNPATTFVVVQSRSDQASSFRLLDATGRVVQQASFMGKASLSLEDVSPGAYLYQIIPVDGPIDAGTLVISR